MLLQRSLTRSAWKTKFKKINQKINHIIHQATLPFPHSSFLSTTKHSFYPLTPFALVTNLSGEQHRIFLFPPKHGLNSIFKLHLLRSFASASEKRTISEEESAKSSSEDSAQSEQPRESEEQIRFQILNCSLEEVKKYGWTMEAISMGAKAAGYLNVTHGILENGIIDLVYFFVTHLNRELVLKLSKLDLSRMTLKEKLFTMIQLRLQMLIPYIQTWSQALALLALPQNLPQSTESLAILIDEMWYQAGASHVDFDWYTKRLSLGAVYVATELHMLTDASKDFADTWKFLERRLDDMSSCSQTLIEVEKTFGIIGKAVFALLLPKTSHRTQTNQQSNPQSNQQTNPQSNPQSNQQTNQQASTLRITPEDD
jgi:ubiquinone biosynthesis protein COQ9